MPSSTTYVRDSTGNWVDICKCKYRKSDGTWAPHIKNQDKVRKPDGTWHDILCEVPCSTQASYGGGVGYGIIHTVSLGTGLGQVSFEYGAGALPDKFIVLFDGVEVINTGYVGDPIHQTALNTALVSMGLPPETITDSDGHQTGLGATFFNKTTTTTTATVIVYAPLPATGWSFILNCPATEIFFSERQSKDYTKNDCASGTGTTVSYVVNAHVYSSSISVADANVRPIALVNSSAGQDYANEHGSCV